MFSSASTKWDTPKWLLALLAPAFNWDVDVCASGPNVCDRYYDESQDGLSKQWHGLCWMNPPYKRHVINQWVRKAYKSSKRHATVICLLPARTDTQWWQNHVPYANLCVFMKGRLKFGDATNSAPFPSAIVAFGPLNCIQRTTLLNIEGYAIERTSKWTT